MSINKDNMPNEIDIIDGYNQLVNSFGMMASEFNTAKDKDRTMEIVVDHLIREAKVLNYIMRKAGKENMVSARYLDEFKDKVYKQLDHSSKTH